MAQITTDTLFVKIGVLSVEGDALRQELQRVTQERDELRKIVDQQPDVEKEAPRPAPKP